jgi:hypothetical protein
MVNKRSSTNILRYPLFDKPFEWFSTSGTHKPAVSVLQSLDILLLYGSLAALRQSHLLTGLGQGQIQGALLGLMLGLSGNLP